MSNDLDDQLYILLASMKEYREAIGDDRKRLEQFYKVVANGVLDKAEKSLILTNKQATEDLKQRIRELDRATGRLDWHFVALYSTAFIGLVVILFLALFLFVPSMDDVRERRAEIARLNLDIATCGGKTCVRVMKKQCGYGENRDYCVIDPK